ncbi:MAG: hypothetical protein ABSC72_13900 [Methylovirgula sp.]
MRPDLLEAQAAIDWPIEWLPDLTQRLNAWLERSITIEKRDAGENAEFDPIVAVETELLPLAFNVEVGAYINTIRSSLDMLAMSLMRRYDVPIKESQVSFPIAKDKAEFEKSELLRGLPDEPRGLMEAIRPYKEGNNLLFALHRLDILRKHRRLLKVELRPIHMSLTGTLKPGDFEPLATGTIQVGSETVLGLMRKGVAPTLVRSSFYVSIQEAEYLEKKPVIAVLHRLAMEAQTVINVFDF